MSYQKAKQVRDAARRKLAAHYGQDPQNELDAKAVAQLEKDIELAEVHMEDCDD